MRILRCLPEIIRSIFLEIVRSIRRFLLRDRLIFIDRRVRSRFPGTPLTYDSVWGWYCEDLGVADRLPRCAVVYPYLPLVVLWFHNSEVEDKLQQMGVPCFRLDTDDDRKLDEVLKIIGETAISP